MKFKKLNIIFKNTKIQNKKINFILKYSFKLNIIF